MADWALRYGIRARDGRVIGTMIVPLKQVRRGMSPHDEAMAYIKRFYATGATPINPTRVLVDDELESVA